MKWEEKSEVGGVKSEENEESESVKCGEGSVKRMWGSEVMNMKRVFGVILAAAVLIGGCDFILGPDEPVGGGNLVIGFGEGGGASLASVSRGVVPTAKEQAELRYELVLTGPGDQRITVSLAPGESFNQQVSLGEWHIYAEAYNPGNVFIGTGTAVATVKAGQNEARVWMSTWNPGAQSTRTISGVSVPFRYVPAGSFQRDATAENVSIITNGYWMGETEVTQELFKAVMGDNPSDCTSNPEDPGEDGWKKLPVETVYWYHAIAFCNKLSLADGKEPVYAVSGVSDWAALLYGAIPTTDDADWNAAAMDTGKNGYRLPTEMEWMWAAMGADTTSQPNTEGYTKAFAGRNGSNNLGDYAWFPSNSGNKTHEVGKKMATELGVYDMSGNVSEWFWDLYDSYPAGEQTNFAGTASGTKRVERGGCHYNGDAACAVSNRSSLNPDVGNYGLGFRVVCP
jgi:formylglycine-generating enzyme required for sulfatase activity